MHSYKTLEAWKRAHVAVLLVFQATDRARHPRAFGLFDQLKRATLSVESNIVEGYALGTVPLCRRHLRIAFGSAAEAECQTRIAAELGYLPDTEVGQIADALSGAMRAIYGLMLSPPVIRHRHFTGRNHSPHTTPL
jgi:four helix bundle protein